MVSISASYLRLGRHLIIVEVDLPILEVPNDDVQFRVSEIQFQSMFLFKLLHKQNAIYNCIESKKMSDHVITLNAHLIDGRETNLM